MTTTNDMTDEGQPVPVSLDLTDDRAFSVITHALVAFAFEQRAIAEDLIVSEQPEVDAAVLAAYADADTADRLREQIESQVDTLSAPQEKSE